MNDPVRRAALRQIQQTYGNRAAQRVVSNRGQATADTAARPPGTHGVQPAGAANRSSGESEDRAVAATTSVRPTGSAERQPGTAPTSARAPRTAARGRGAAGADTHGPAAASSEHQAPASRDAPRVAVEQTGKPTEPAVDEPFRLDPPEPLAVAPILIAFPAPASLAVEALRFPALPPQAAEAGADKNRSAADAAREAYTDAARGARAESNPCWENRTPPSPAWPRHTTWQSSAEWRCSSGSHQSWISSSMAPARGSSVREDRGSLDRHCGQ